MFLLENGRFYAPSTPGISTLLIDQGKIIAIAGRDHNLDSHYKITKKFNLHGLTVWPGIIDSHLHLAKYSLSQSMVECETDTLEECLQRVDQAARQALPGAWIFGHGWNQHTWVHGYGTAKQLDSVSHEHPVFLTSKSMHAAWVNSLVLNAASISSITPDPDGGRILHDDAGDPSGILLESASNLIQSIIPEKSQADIDQSLIHGIQLLNRFGITAVHDFDSLDNLAAYQRVDERGKLFLRILKIVPPADHHKAITGNLRSKGMCGSIQIGPYKFFMDGALGTHTAALDEPYNGEKNTGILNFSEEDLTDRCLELIHFNSDLTIHAIGDRAIRLTMAAFQAIREHEKSIGKYPARLRVEHVQLINRSNLLDFLDLSVTASMQPIHATSDMSTANEYWGDRVERSYAWKSLLKHGARIIFGSDAPVESPNPFWGLHAAVTRQRRDGSPGPEGWIPSERIQLKDALDAYTTHPADEFNDPAINARIEVGGWADLIVLPKNPFFEKAQNLHQIQPMATMMNGRWVWMDRDMEL
jgi:predicted amidohydrolase YtcJ